MNERICPECGGTFDSTDMTWTYDCHGIPFMFVCYGCAGKMTEENGYAGERYTDMDEQIEADY